MKYIVHILEWVFDLFENRKLYTGYLSSQENSCKYLSKSSLGGPKQKSTRLAVKVKYKMIHMKN